MDSIFYQTFSADDPWYEITKGENEFLAPQWVHSECDPEEAVRAICENYFNPSDWNEEFGDSDSVEVLVKVRAPGYLRGCYIVTMEREIKATALQVDDPRPEWAQKKHP